MKTQKTTVHFKVIHEEEQRALKEIWKTGTAADQRHPLKTDAFKEFKEDHNPAKRDCDSPREWSRPPPHREAGRDSSDGGIGKQPMTTKQTSVPFQVIQTQPPTQELSLNLVLLEIEP